MTVTVSGPDEFLWVEKYRPKNIEETILPESLKATFREFVAQKNIPNLILAGGAGIGKTTVARAMLEEIGCDYIIINASMDNGIDVLRTHIKNYASTVSFKGGRKYIILDEADHLSHAVQPALRNFMEEFSKNCGFILTCNFKNRIISPLHSRCSVIDFNFNKKDLAVIASKFLNRVCEILVLEGVEYDKSSVASLITSYYPDWRRVINELQRYSTNGKIDSGVLASLSDESIETLIKFMKAKDFVSVRRWIAENPQDNPSALFKNIYDRLGLFLTPRSIPQIVLHIAQYEYQSAFVVNQDINTAAALLQIMHDAEYL